MSLLAPLRASGSPRLTPFRTPCTPLLTPLRAPYTSLMAPLRTNRLGPCLGYGQHRRRRREVERGNQSQKGKRLSMGDLFRFDHFAYGQNSSRGSGEVF
jgi:hypothetical protein